MRKEKLAQKQRIGRLEKVSSMNYLRLHKLEEAIRELQSKLGINEEE